MVGDGGLGELEERYALADADLAGVLAQDVDELEADPISALDLSYTLPLGSPWEALQTGAQTWQRETANGGSA